MLARGAAGLACSDRTVCTLALVCGRADRGIHCTCAGGDLVAWLPTLVAGRFYTDLASSFAD